MSTQHQTEFQAQIEADLERVQNFVDGEGSGRPYSNGEAIAALMQTIEHLAAKVALLDAYIEKQARRSY